MSFSSVTVRENGLDVTANWWNDLRTAGIALETELSGQFGGGAIAESSFSLTNGQASPANITGVTVDAALYSSMTLDVEIRQKTATAELVFLGTVFMLWRALTSTWDVIMEGNGDDPAIVLSMQTSGTVGQLRYTLDTLAGSGYVGKFKFRARTFNV